jgi:tetratricopeptide (TPR) repeat protein
MDNRRLPIAALVLAILSFSAAAHDDGVKAGRTEGLGRVLFKTSCTPEAQKQFERALAMLHSFYFPETVKAFNETAKTDPNCAIAYWGLAVSNRPNPLVGPFDAATLKRGLDYVEKGEAIGAKTQQERDWLAAIKTYYKDYGTVDQDTRVRRYSDAMEALAKKYPDDVEAKIFYALSLNEIFDHKSMDPLLKAVAILEPLDKKYPDHPGITHYIIHSYDFAPIARKGLPAADKYAKIAPAAPHAQHMPSHIYSMVGKWDESVASNVRSVKVATAYQEANKMDGVLSAIPHSYDFMQYAYLQMGQDAKARALMGDSAKITKLIGVISAGNTARAAVPARYMLERQDWKGAAQLQPLGSPFPPAEAITHFARAMGAARSGDLPAAEADIKRLTELRAGLEKSSQTYWAEQVEIQILAARAWVAQGQGKPEEAFKLMAAAADLEDSSEKHVAMENRLYPMRELFGDMLMIQGQPGAALLAYEQSMKAAPERLRGYYGAAKAADATGDKAKAAGYYRKLAQLTHNADGERTEIKEAKLRVAKL